MVIISIWKRHSCFAQNSANLPITSYGYRIPTPPGAGVVPMPNFQFHQPTPPGEPQTLLSKPLLPLPLWTDMYTG